MKAAKSDEETRGMSKMQTPGELRIGIHGGDGGGYASSRRSSLETAMSGSSSSSSPTSTADTSISEQGYSPLRDTLASGVIPGPGTFVGVGAARYASGEVRVMADMVAQARKTSELPPTQSSPLDAQTITEDYALLSRLRLARGDPALPPPDEYTRLRVEAARRIRERDARLGDDECRRAATERVESYLRVVGQERRYYELLAREGGKGGRDMERIAEEIVEVVERGLSEGIGTTADVLDTAASSLAYTTNTLASTTEYLTSTTEILTSTTNNLTFTTNDLASTTNDLASTTNNLTSTTNSLNSTATTLDATLGVTTSQISALKAQILALTDLLQSQRLAPPPSPPRASIPAHDAPGHDRPRVADSALEDVVRREVTRALRDATTETQKPYPPSPYGTPGTKCRSSSRTVAADGRDSLSSFAAEDTGTKPAATEQREARGRRGGERRTHAQGKRPRRMRRYARIAIDRILG